MFLWFVLKAELYICFPLHSVDAVGGIMLVFKGKWYSPLYGNADT